MRLTNSTIAQYVARDSPSGQVETGTQGLYIVEIRLSMWINLNVTFVIKNYHQGVAGTDTRGQCINPSKHKVVQVENVKCVCDKTFKHRSYRD